MAPLHVTVRLSGELARRLGSRRRLELGEGATVEELLATLACEARLEPAALRGLAVVASGSFVGRGHALADGDALDVLVPAAGG